MRHFLFAAALAGCAAPALAEPIPAGGTVTITIDWDAVETAVAVAGDDPTLRLLDARDGVATLEIDSRKLDALSERMHAEHERCGGFMIENGLDEPRIQRDSPEYTLDHGAVVRAVLPQLDRERIVATIRELQAMPNRYYMSETGAKASEWLRDRWRSFTTRSDVTVELFDQGYPQKSVIMTIPGTTRASEVVVLGGHLDSIAPGRTKSVAPGADDDASGIATLTEVARVLLARDFRPARTVKFMAYAAEEVGLRGSQAIARDYKRRNVDVVGALQLDMTNYQGSDKDIWLIGDFTSAAQNSFLVKLIETYVGATWAFDKCGYACSDHAAWHRAGVPASMPFEARFKEANKAIHTGRDTLETSGGNADHAVKFARLAAAYAIELGKGDLGPPPTPAEQESLTFLGGGLALALVMFWLARAIATRAA